jgi:hypothetical protein
MGISHSHIADNAMTSAAIEALIVRLMQIRDQDAAAVYLRPPAPERAICELEAHCRTFGRAAVLPELIAFYRQTNGLQIENEFLLPAEDCVPMTKDFDAAPGLLRIGGAGSMTVFWADMVVGDFTENWIGEREPELRFATLSELLWTSVTRQGHPRA